MKALNKNKIRKSKISNESALNKLIRAHHHDKTSTSSSNTLSKISALSTLIRAHHHATSSRSALSNISYAPVSVQVPVTKSDLPSQNKVPNQLWNLLNNNDKEMVK